MTKFSPRPVDLEKAYFPVPAIDPNLPVLP